MILQLAVSKYRPALGRSQPLESGHGTAYALVEAAQVKTTAAPPRRVAP
ncbi:MAG TPA: hypothetical protein VNZ03_01995 [Terriglobales bacterium]|nr:hypothetical protein [Terriglobales bacterium]